MFYFCLIKRTIFTINIYIFFRGVLFRPPMELVGPSGKSISGSNKHILKLMIYQTFGHG